MRRMEEIGGKQFLSTMCKAYRTWCGLFQVNAISSAANTARSAASPAAYNSAISRLEEAKSDAANTLANIDEMWLGSPDKQYRFSNHHISDKERDLPLAPKDSSGISRLLVQHATEFEQWLHYGNVNRPHDMIDAVARFNQRNNP